MPPGGTTGKSSSKTGARGPTGPQGQARTSPAGSAGGKAGSVSRTSTAGGKSSGTTRMSTAATNKNPRGPTGPQGQARTSPAGSGGGGAGSISRNSGSVRTNKPAATTGSGVRGPLGPQGERRAPVNTVTGAGQRFGPMANEIVDRRRMQGPPTQDQAYYQMARDFERRLRDIDRFREQEALSTVAGIFSKTGAQYGPTRTQIARDNAKYKAADARNYMVQNTNRDRMSNPYKDTVSPEISRAVPNVKLPSRMTTFDKAAQAYSKARQSFGNALYGEPEVTRSQKTDRQRSNMFKNGGLVTKKGRVPPKGCK